MATNTYVALNKITAAAASTISFTSIPQGYTDLIIVCQGKSTNAGSSTNSYRVQFNGDTTAVYSGTYLYGNGSTANSGRDTGLNQLYLGELDQASNTSNSVSILQFMNYSNTTTFKTVLSRGNSASVATSAQVGLWRSTAAINRIDLYLAGQTITGTFSLYGIAAEPFAAKATGGTIAYANGYWTHTFTSSGTFTPTQPLSCDYLVVAGGGGGGPGILDNTEAGGGGGGGGFRTSIGGSPLSVAATAYSITVGAAGAGSTSSTAAGGNGTNSVFSTISATGGGGGGGASVLNGLSGGSGGGARGYSGTGGSGNAGAYTPVEGYAGGSATTTKDGGSGGGGAGAVGSQPTAQYRGGAGGNGAASSLSGSSVTYAGGGGGGTYNQDLTGNEGGSGGGGRGGRGNWNSGEIGINPVAGTTNLGGGGGGGFTNAGAVGSNGANGGSGIVIIRYAN